MSELNLIPYKLKQKRVKASQLKNYISYGIIIASIFIMLILLPNLYVTLLTNQENTIAYKISQNSSTIAENKKVTADIQNYKLFNDKVDLLTKNKVKVSDQLSNMAKYKPKDITLLNIGLSKGAITISGNATNVTAISVFVASLQTTKDYSSAKIVNIASVKSSTNNQSSSDKYQFSISIPN